MRKPTKAQAKAIERAEIRASLKGTVTTGSVFTIEWEKNNGVWEWVQCSGCASEARAKQCRDQWCAVAAVNVDHTRIVEITLDDWLYLNRIGMKDRLKIDDDA